jgi:RimJ/RimL family protein N-acetyltransferase
VNKTVVTDRLILRPFEAQDIPAYAAIRAKPEVMRHLPGGVARVATAKADAERMASIYAESWTAIGYAPWAAIDRETGALLGHLGLRFLPELGGETEILYLFDSPAWGKGLATEGAFAARNFAFQTLGLKKLIGLVAPLNTPSQRVLEKIGMKPRGETKAFGIDLKLYEHWGES